MRGTFVFNDRQIPLERLSEVIQRHSPANQNHGELVSIARALSLTLNEVTDTVNFVQSVVAYNLETTHSSSHEVVKLVADSSLNSTQKVMAAWQLARILNYLEVAGALPLDLEKELDKVIETIPVHILYDFISLDQMQQAVAEANFILQEHERTIRFRLVEDVLKRPDYTPAVKAHFTALLVIENDIDNGKFFGVLEEAVKQARRAAAAQAGQ